MPITNEVSLEFHCGICAEKLTDGTALFTSCGHFFCANSSRNCTLLHPGSNSGRCEQCGKDCDAGVLSNRGSRYDSRVRSFVFSDIQKRLEETAAEVKEKALDLEKLHKESRKMAEIVQFRKTHLEILGENVAAQTKMIQTLRAEVKQLITEKESISEEKEKQGLRSKQLELEVAKLRKEVSFLKRGNRGAEPIDRTMVERGRNDVRERGNYADANDDVIDVDSPSPARSLLRIDPKRRLIRTNLVVGSDKHAQQTRRKSSVIRKDDNSFTRESYHRDTSAQPLSRTYRSWATGQSPVLQDTASVRKLQRSSRAFGKSSGRRNGWQRSPVSQPCVDSRFHHKDHSGSKDMPRSELIPLRSRGDWQRRVSSVPRPSLSGERLRNPRRKCDSGGFPSRFSNRADF